MKIILTLSFVLLFSKGFCCTCVSINNVSIDRTVSYTNFIASCLIKSCDTIMYSDTLSSLKIDSINTYYEIVNIQKLRYKIQIIEEFKNITRNGTNIEYIVSGTGRGDCGFLFEVGKTYIIFAQQQKLLAAKKPLIGYFIETDACTKTCVYNTKIANALFNIPSIKKHNKKWKKHGSR